MYNNCNNVVDVKPTVEIVRILYRPYSLLRTKRILFYGIIHFMKLSLITNYWNVYWFVPLNHKYVRYISHV